MLEGVLTCVLDSAVWKEAAVIDGLVIAERCCLSFDGAFYRRYASTKGLPFSLTGSRRKKLVQQQEYSQIFHRRQVKMTATRSCPAQVSRQKDPPSLLSDTHQVRCGNQMMNDDICRCSSSSFTTTNHTSLPPCNNTMNGHEEQPPPPPINDPPPQDLANVMTAHEHNVNAQE